MKIRHIFLTNFFVAVLGVLAATDPASAALITIDEAGDGPIAAGDYVVSGNQDASSPGQVNEVLFGPGGPNTSEVSGSNTLSIAAVWDILNNGGVTSTTSLYLAFGNNQQGSSMAEQTTTITQLDIAISNTESYNDTWSLNGDTVAVVNFQGGQNTAEAIFEIALGYDFMSIFDGSSAGNFTITSTYTGNNDGFEIYFFDPQFFAPPEPPTVPEPGTLALLGLGLLGLSFSRRRKV